MISFPFEPQTLSLSSWPLIALNMENLDGDYYVPGTELEGFEGIWKQIEAT